MTLLADISGKGRQVVTQVYWTGQVSPDFQVHLVMEDQDHVEYVAQPDGTFAQPTTISSPKDKA